MTNKRFEFGDKNGNLRKLLQTDEWRRQSFYQEIWSWPLKPENFTIANKYDALVF